MFQAQSDDYASRTATATEEMAKQMRALDSYGAYDGWPVERIQVKILDPGKA